MIVSISTISVRKAAKTNLEQLRFIEKNFSGLIDGVELCFIHRKDFLEFAPDKKSIAFLNGLKFNTLHAPITQVYYKDAEAKETFEKMRSLTKIVPFKQVTFHPNQVLDFSVLPAKEFNVCVENQPDGKTKKRWQYPKQFQAFFKKHKEIDFCFDVNHAIANNIEPKEFTNRFKDKIQYVHLSATKPGNADHGLLLESSKQTMESILPVFPPQKPLVIEVNIEKEKIPLIKKEIELIRTLGKNV